MFLNLVGGGANTVVGWLEGRERGGEPTSTSALFDEQKIS